MATICLVRPRTRTRGWMCLVTVTFVVSLVSCAGGGEADLSEVVEAVDAEAGKTIRSDEWAVTLVSPPQLAKMVGTGPEIDRSLVGDVATDNSAPAGGRQGRLEAEGMWLVQPAAGRAGWKLKGCGWSSPLRSPTRREIWRCCPRDC